MRSVRSATVQWKCHTFCQLQISKNQFTQPALFFNLRGNACDHPVQHDLLLDLASTLVLFIDISELHLHCVQEKLREDVTKTHSSIVVVLTDNNGHDEDAIEEFSDLFSDVVGEALDDIRCITTFELEGGIKNMTSVITDITKAIHASMSECPELSLR